jgi:hypothetical protein
MAGQNPGGKSKTIHLWIATLDTRHFTFEAVGTSRQEACDLMCKAWNLHRESYPEQEREAIHVYDLVKDDVVVRMLWAGAMLRDGQSVRRK